MRALCMVLVYLMHSEIYFLSEEELSGLIYATSPFRVSVFFFISGFLFLGRYFTQEKDCSPPELTAMSRRIIRKLAWPTVAFASIIYLPKKLFHQDSITFVQYLYDVWGGMSYWFTSALCVAQLLLLVMLWCYKGDGRKCFITALCLAALAQYLSGLGWPAFPWHYTTAAAALPLLVSGGLYYKHQETVQRYLERGWVVLPLAAVYLGIIVFSWKTRCVIPWHYNREWNVENILALVTGLSVFMTLCRHLPSMRWCDYMGRHTIVFYFLSGVMPAFVSTVFHLLFPGLLYPVLCIPVALVSLLLSSIATHLVFRYFRILLGDFPSK